MTGSTNQRQLPERFTSRYIKKKQQCLSALFNLFLLFVISGSGISSVYAFEKAISNSQVTKLTLVKTVFNSHGGNADISDFGITTSAGPLSFTITSDAFSFGLNGAIARTTTYTSATLTVDANTAYTLSENDLAGYAEGNWNCSNGDSGAFNTALVTLDKGESVTCSIVNNDQATATLSLKKTIINDSNAPTNDTDWILTATGPVTISGIEAAPAVTSALVPAGIYTLSGSGPYGFQIISWSCTSGTLVDDQLTLTPDETAVCTATIDANEHAKPIPTLSEWMLVLLLLLLLVTGRHKSISHQRQKN